MNPLTPAAKAQPHLKTSGQNDVIFNEDAVEISILDRWGKAIWSKKREAPVEPLLWNGITCYGEKAAGGSYLCKIVYPQSQVVYVPFVFIQK